MSPEKEQAIFLRWPEWFRSAADIRKSLMSFGFCCGDGWYAILWQLFETLEPHVAALDRGHDDQTNDDQGDEPFEILQVKEKFGGLRCYVNRHSDEINAAIESAEQACSRTCERCGNPGTLNTDGWWKTLCSSCLAERPLFHGPEF